MLFNNCRLTAVILVQFKSKHFELVAKCLNQPKNKKSFGNNRKWSFNYTPIRSVSLLTLVLIFQTAITGGWRSHVAILFSATQRVAEYLVALKHFDYSWSLGYKQPITSKTIMTSPRRNEHYKRPKTSWFDFVFPCAFKNKHRFENFFAHIMEGIGTLWLFKFGMSQNNRDVTATISNSVLIFLLNAS